MVLVEYNKGKTELFEIRWDEKKAHFSKLNSGQPHIWASVTLYPQQVREQREQWFAEYLKRGDFSVHGIRKFHQFGGNGDKENDLVMERGSVLSTVSISSVEFDDRGGEFIYQDLLKDETKREFI